MIFDNKVLSLGSGRVSTACRYDDVVIVMMSNGQNIAQMRIVNNVVSTVNPRLFSYADDAMFVAGQLLERHAGRLSWVDEDL
jgi:hypothetical protein